VHSTSSRGRICQTMRKDRPSITSLLVALFGVVFQGGDQYGRSLLPSANNDIVRAQIAILKAAGLVPQWLPNGVLSNPVVAKALRALTNVFMDDCFDGLSFRKSWIEARVRSALLLTETTAAALGGECSNDNNNNNNNVYENNVYENNNNNNNNNNKYNKHQTVVLIVAAGYDTLAYRLSKEYPSVQFFELDHPATSAVKRRAIQALQAEDRVHLIAGDLTEASLETILRSSGHYGGTEHRFPMYKTTIVVVEGLTFYLTEAQNIQLLREIAQCTGPGSIALLDHFTAQSLQRQGPLVRITASLKEPMKFGMPLEDVAAFAKRSAWTLVDQGQKGHECLAMFSHGQQQQQLSSEGIVRIL
jgi:methyltransferase (TIGR00027 family)